MNLMIYASRKNFDVQKTERWFKERRIAYQSVDLKKHRLGEKELTLFIQQAGSARALVDRAAKGERAAYVQHLSTESVIAEVLLESPELLCTPIVRDGRRITVGYCPEVWATWIGE